LTYGEDTVKSYFGLRSIDYRDNKFYLNGRSVFQRLVLDQGFYPDGIYTAPSDKALEGDIDMSMAMGFNGARLHEKIFEERFLYYADKEIYHSCCKRRNRYIRRYNYRKQPDKPCFCGSR
jgi:beta-galactosidase/beta-glucuronidase